MNRKKAAGIASAIAFVGFGIWLVYSSGVHAPQLALAGDTGFQIAGSGVNDTSLGGVTDWNNPGDITASDDNKANIVGASNVTVATTTLYLNGAPIGEIKRTPWNLSSASDITATLGGDGDRWGTSLTVADVEDADFGIGFQGVGNGGLGISRVLLATNFNFDLPNDALVTGIEIQLEGVYNTANFRIDAVSMKVHYGTGGEVIPQTFASPGYSTWTAPPGVTTAYVSAWGGGGGGGDGSLNGGAGGGGGAFASSTVAHHIYHLCRFRRRWRIVTNRACRITRHRQHLRNYHSGSRWRFWRWRIGCCRRCRRNDRQLNRYDGVRRRSRRGLKHHWRHLRRRRRIGRPQWNGRERCGWHGFHRWRRRWWRRRRKQRIRSDRRLFDERRRRWEWRQRRSGRTRHSQC